MNVFKRFNVRCPIVIEYFGEIRGTPVPVISAVGQSRNLSSSGLGIHFVTNARPEVGEPVEMTLGVRPLCEIPSEGVPEPIILFDPDTESRGKIIQIRASVIWRKHHDYGLKITQMDSASMALYAGLLKTMNSRTPAPIVPPPFRK